MLPKSPLTFVSMHLIPPHETAAVPVAMERGDGSSTVSQLVREE